MSDITTVAAETSEAAPSATGVGTMPGETPTDVPCHLSTDSSVQQEGPAEATTTTQIAPDEEWLRDVKDLVAARDREFLEERRALVV
jgi:hypothetical protein